MPPEEEFPANMQKHFDAAGIVEPANTGIAASEKDTTADTTSAPSTAVPVTPKDETQGQTPSGTEPKPAAGDSKSGGTDGTGKPGEAAPATEVVRTDAEEITALRAGGKLNPNVAQRWFNQRETARQQLTVRETELTTARQQLQSVQTELQGFKEASTQMAGLAPEEASQAVRLFKDLARDPKGTITAILAEAKAQGLTFEDVGGTVDTRAIQALIDQRLGGQQQQRVDPQEQAQRIEAEANREVGEFFTQYPDAVIHDEVLARVSASHPNATLTDVYFTVKNAVIAKGFDWSQPLQPQIDRMKAQPQGQSQVATPAQKAMPNGRGGVDTQAVERDAEQIPADGGTTDDIVRQAMRDNGYNI